MAKTLTPFQRTVYDALQHERVMSHGELPENYGTDAYVIAERIESSQAAVTKALDALYRMGLATWIPKEKFPDKGRGVWWWKTWKAVDEA